MKNALVLLFLLSFFTAQAQKIHFSDKTNQWVYAYQGGDLCNGFKYVSYGNDTFMFGQTYKPLKGLSSIPGGFSGCTPSNPYDSGLFIREDTIAGIVYSIFPFDIDSTEKILFNYNWQVGDTAVSYSTFPYLVDTISAIDSILIDTIYYKEFFLTTCYPLSGVSANAVVIEGIGTPGWILVPFYTDYFEYAECLLCFSNNGTWPMINASTFGVDGWFPGCDTFINSPGCTVLKISTPTITKPQNSVTISPNPFSTEITFESGSDIHEIIVTSITGQIILTARPKSTSATLPIPELPPGMYFVDIRYGEDGNMRQINKIIRE